MVKVAIATESRRGLDDVVAPRFARAGTFTIIDLGSEGGVVSVKVIDNPAAESPGGAGVRATQLLADEGVEVVVGPGFGPNAAAILAELGIKTVTVPPGTPVKEAVEEVRKQLG